MSQLYSASPSMLRNNPILFVLLLVIPVVGWIALLIWRLNCKASKLIITDKEITYEKGLLSKVRSELNTSSVRTTKVSQSFFNRLLGTGTVEIFTAGDTAEITVDGMPHPNKIRELIKSHATA